MTNGSKIIRSIPFLLRMMLSGNAGRIPGWLESLAPDYLVENGIPWITFAAKDHLDSLDLRGARVFEYGSGGSTLYWVRRGAHCVSVEHDAAWFHLHEKRFRSEGVDYRLIPPDPIGSSKGGAVERDFADPTAYLSSDPSLEGYELRTYASSIDTFPLESFDIVLVDGRARPSCIAHAVSRIGRSGRLIVDNSDRQYYFDQTSHLLRSAHSIHYRGPGPTTACIWQTSVFVFEEQSH